jgi:two-component system sensor histidine kinase DesK
MLSGIFKRPRDGPPLAFTFIWLVYMIFPIYSLVSRPWPEEAVGFPLLLVFVALYLYGYLERRGRLLSILAQIAIVCYFAYRYDVNFLYMAFYPSPMIAMLANRKQIVGAAAALLALFGFIGWHYQLLTKSDELIQLMPVLLIILFMPVGLRIGRRSKELREKLTLANDEIARLSKNEERQRISRDLHDTLGHTLSLITLKSELAEKLIPKQPMRAAQEIRDVQMTSRAALKQVRELISGMNAVTVRDEIAHAKQILAAAGMNLELEGEFGEDGPSPAPLVDNMLGMGLREAVTNVVKHSRARVCAIRWIETQDSYTLTVADDGIGTESNHMDGDTTKNGIQGMRNRLKLVEGDVTLESAAGRGTRVSMTVPRVTKSGGTE